MIRIRFTNATTAAALLLLVLPLHALATRLQVSPEAPLAAHLGAALLLILHIGGGAVGLTAGTVAVIARKGSRVHRAAGKVFFIAMLVCYVVAAGVAPFLTDGQRPNFVAAVLSVYLLLSGISAARRRAFQAGKWEISGLLVALAIIGMGALFMVMGMNHPSGTVDGTPPQAFILFMAIGTLAAAGELKVIIRRTLDNHARTIRHLWRMGASFFIASASLFLGQAQLFPQWFNQSFLPAALSFAPIVVALFWIARLKVLRYKTMAAA